MELLVAELWSFFRDAIKKISFYFRKNSTIGEFRGYLLWRVENRKYEKNAIFFKIKSAISIFGEYLLVKGEE